MEQARTRARKTDQKEKTKMKQELKALWQIVKFFASIALMIAAAWLTLSVIGVAFGGGF